MLTVLCYFVLSIILRVFVPGMNNLCQMSASIVGFTMGTVITAKNRERGPKKLKVVGVGVLFLYFTGSLYLFYKFRDP